MIVERDVVRFAGDAPGDHRVVWADQHAVWLFDLGSPRTSFSRWSRGDLVAKLEAKEAVIATDHDHNVFFLDSALSEKRRARRDAMAKVVEPLIARAPDIFDDRIRGVAVADLDRAGVRSAKTVHAALDRWWRGGMTVDALVQGFNAGKHHSRKPDAKRSGRKQPKGAPQGVVVTAGIEKAFRDGVRRFVATDRRNSLSAAYRMIRAENWVDEIRDRVTGAVTYRTKPEFAETGFPTLRQFRFWYGKQDGDVLGIRRKRMGAANYDKDCKATTGSAKEHLLGAGSRFEIDATQLEIGTVSGINGEVYVDPPTFYKVVDTLTGLICGIYVGHEEASFTGARMAIRNVAADKVEFAARFGVTIERRQWPCQGVLPKRLMADNAEFKGELATGFVGKSRVVVENARPLMGPDKGTVEGKFNLFKTELRKRLPGLRRKNQANPGDVDHSRDACLTLHDVTVAVIETVVLLNNRLMGSQPSREMMEAGVLAVPSEMWEWALTTGAHELIRADEATAEFAMLPTDTATVTGDGLKFEQLFYMGGGSRWAALVERARQDGVSRVDISYDPNFTTDIYVHDPKAPAGFHVFSLTGDSKAYHGVSFHDAKAMRAWVDVKGRLRQFEQAENEARFEGSTAAMVRKAKARKTPRFRASDVKKGRQNKKAEAERQRATYDTALPRTAPRSQGEVIRAEDRFAHQQQRQRSEPKPDMFGDDAFDTWVSNGDKS